MYYFHGVANGLVDKKVIYILNKREISSARRLGIPKRIGFNEEDFVSVCSNMGQEFYDTGINNAFNKYIVNHFCFIIDGSIEVCKPEFIPEASKMSTLDLFNLKRNNPDKRFSDIIDEYQVRECIPFDNVIAIGIPYSLGSKHGQIKLSDFCYLTETEFLELIEKVERIASDLGIPIVDSASLEFVTMFSDSAIKEQKNL